MISTEVDPCQFDLLPLAFAAPTSRAWHPEADCWHIDQLLVCWTLPLPFLVLSWSVVFKRKEKNEIHELFKSSNSQFSLCQSSAKFSPKTKFEAQDEADSPWRHSWCLRHGHEPQIPPAPSRKKGNLTHFEVLGSPIKFLSARIHTSLYSSISSALSSTRVGGLRRAILDDAVGAVVKQRDTNPEFELLFFSRGAVSTTHMQY